MNCTGSAEKENLKIDFIFTSSTYTFPCYYFTSFHPGHPSIDWNTNTLIAICNVLKWRFQDKRRKYWYSGLGSLLHLLSAVFDTTSIVLHVQLGPAQWCFLQMLQTLLKAFLNITSDISFPCVQDFCTSIFSVSILK